VPNGTDVEFDQVSVAYPQSSVPSLPSGAAAAPSAVLDGVSFRLPERGLTAMVGPSGAGKTTVARLLARFWDTTAGTVRVGGVGVRDIAPERLAATVAIVFQDVYLFDDTIEENVRIGDCADPDGLDPEDLPAVESVEGLLPFLGIRCINVHQFPGTAAVRGPGVRMPMGRGARLGHRHARCASCQDRGRRHCVPSVDGQTG
jgi:ABC-type multidrug transport system ATPase subunit